ncbi:MAG: hypothetical protein KAR42_17350 [candidate division Zixibacteria bacterium]|nr:hypothetical protein [candidate division Zixibacteria bacterium]
MLRKNVLISIIMMFCLVLAMPEAAAETRTIKHLDEIDYREGTPGQVKSDNPGIDDTNCIGLTEGGTVGIGFTSFTRVSITFWIKLRNDHNRIYCRILEKGYDNYITLRIEPEGKYGCKVLMNQRDGDVEETIRSSKSLDSKVRDSWAKVEFDVAPTESVAGSSTSFTCYVRVGDGNNNDVSAIAENSDRFQWNAREFDAVEFFVKDNQDYTTHLDDITVRTTVSDIPAFTIGMPGSSGSGTVILGGALILGALYLISSRNGGSRKASKSKGRSMN